MINEFEIAIAIRHIIARKRQTILSVLAVALAVSISLFFTSLANGSQVLLTDIVIEKLPHITVSAKEGEDYIYLYKSLMDRVKSLKGVSSTSASLVTTATVAYKDISKNVALKGVMPQDVDQVYKISESIVEGNFSAVLGGKRVVIGRKLADDLLVKMGDRIDVSFPRRKGTNLTVAGIFDTGTPLDGTVAFVSLKTARDFLGKGDVANVIEVRIDDINRAESLAKEIALTGYRAKGWQETSPEIQRSLTIGRFFSRIAVLLAMIVASLGIANSMSMRVMDKTREIGMLLAMGANRRNIIKIFLFESTMLGVIGSALGSVLGVAAINLVGNFEFEIQAGVREITTIPLTIYLWDVPTFSLLAIALCLIAGIYPAINASRLDPVDAIKG